MPIAIAHLEQYLREQPERIPPNESRESLLHRAEVLDTDGDGVLGTSDVQDLIGHAQTSELTRLIETEPAYMKISIERLQQQGLKE